MPDLLRWLGRKLQLFSWALIFAAMAAGLLGTSVIMEVLQLLEP